jgi:hypothetical protein
MAKTMTAGDEAVRVAKEKTDTVRTLSTGVRVRLQQVSLDTLDRAMRKLAKPEVPMWFNEDKGREEPNPNDPDYLAAVAQYNVDQYRVSRDIFVLFGMELVDGMPADDSWLRRLRLLERLGDIDLSAFDLDDPIDREFLYKQHVALGAPDMPLISTIWGVSMPEVEKAAEFFRGDALRPADSGVPATG